MLFLLEKTAIIMGGYSDNSSEAVIHSSIEFFTHQKLDCDYGPPIRPLPSPLTVSGAPMVWADPFLLVQGGKIGGQNMTIGKPNMPS